MKKIIIFIMTFVLMFSLTSCQTDKSDNKKTEAVSSKKNNSDTEKIKTDSVVIYSGLSPRTLDQHDSTDVSTAILIRNLYANLYRLDVNGKIVPELAKSYKVNSDYTKYTITLKDGLKFSDGSPLTARDVAYSYERGMKSEVTYYEILKSVKAKNDNTVEIVLKDPNNSFLNDLTVEYMCVMSKNAIEDGMDVAKLPTVTSGAYTVVKWEKDKSIELKANPYYLGGEPSIKNAEIVYKLSEENAYTALKNGSIDYIASAATKEVPYLKADDNIELISYDNLAWKFLSLNQRKKELADEKVRRAIYYALDLNYIIDSALDGMGTPAPIMVNGSIAGYIHGCEKTEFNLKKAKKYMAESAYPDGFDLTIEAGNDEYEKVAEEIKTLLSQIKIKVKIKKMELNKVLDDMYSFKYEAALISYSMSSGNVSHVAPMFKKGNTLNFASSKDGRIGELLEKSIAVKEEQRNTVLKKAYKLMKEQNIYIGLYWPTIYDAKNIALKQKEEVNSEKFIIANMYWDI